jgi:hypothetical protein
MHTAVRSTICGPRHHSLDAPRPISPGPSRRGRDAIEANDGIGDTREYNIYICSSGMFDLAWNGSPEAHRTRYARLVPRSIV